MKPVEQVEKKREQLVGEMSRAGKPTQERMVKRQTWRCPLLSGRRASNRGNKASVEVQPRPTAHRGAIVSERSGAGRQDAQREVSGI